MGGDKAKQNENKTLIFEIMEGEISINKRTYLN